MMKSKKSSSLFDTAQLVIPGGVNSPVRAFRSVGGAPYSFKKPVALTYTMSMEIVSLTMFCPGDQ